MMHIPQEGMADRCLHNCMTFLRIDLRVFGAPRAAGAGGGREHRLRHGRGRRRRYGVVAEEGGLPLLPEGQERAQPGRRHPLPGTVAISSPPLSCTPTIYFLVLDVGCFGSNCSILCSNCCCSTSGFGCS